MIRRATWLLAAAARRRGRPPSSKNKVTSAVATSKSHTTTTTTTRAASSRRTNTNTTTNKAKSQQQQRSKSHETSSAKTGQTARDDASDAARVRPAYMSEAREAEVLALAERMQVHDLTGDVPVASFALEIIRAHPSVRDMGLRERMDFLCTRWSRLSHKKRLEYLNDPLRGLLPKEYGSNTSSTS